MNHAGVKGRSLEFWRGWSARDVCDWRWCWIVENPIEKQTHGSRYSNSFPFSRHKASKKLSESSTKNSFTYFGQVFFFISTLYIRCDKAKINYLHVVERSNYMLAKRSNVITAETWGKNEKEDLTENM
jgi:hypothetical protein